MEFEFSGSARDVNLDGRQTTAGEGEGFLRSATSTSVAGMMASLLSVFAVLTSGSERSDWMRIETLAHQPLGLLGRTSLGHGDVASPEFITVEIVQGSRRQFRSGHGHKGKSA